MGSYPLLSISEEDVQYFAKNHIEPSFELSVEVADQIAQNLADRWELDYDYETFMEEGVKEEITDMLENNPELKDNGIHKITERDNSDE